ncbi:MAG: DUF3576 domain-containing protein [Rhodospirillaceae bacterium]
MSLVRLSLCAAALAVTLNLSGCDTYEPGVPDLSGDKGRGLDNFAKNKNRKTIWGESGLSLFGDESGGGGGDIGVNAFLWRASLDTIAFMPVNSADAFGGVIITDWHSSAEAPNERFKLNVYILGRTLRADGIRVAVFRQVFTRNGQWVDAPVPTETRLKIEDSILTRARQLRNAAVTQQK